MNIKDYDKLEPSKRKEMLNKAIILNDKQIKKYSSLLEEYKECKNCLNEFSKNEFSVNDNSFISNIISDKDSVVLYTIPYDEGWSATVNGKKVDIQKVDHGLMAVEIKKGNNIIEFNYFPKGLKLGIIISIISCFIFIINFVIYKKIKKNL